MARQWFLYRSRVIGLSILLAGMGITCLVCGEKAHAATYYVSKSTANSWSIGKDSNTCATMSAPCLSIGGGLSKMSSGDTLIINDGTYSESLDDAVPSGGGTEATRTVVKCFKVLACTLDASFFAWSFVNSDTNWITIQDMVICCGGNILVTLRTTSTLPTTNYPHHIRIQNNDIHTSSIYCVYTGHGQFNEFINNSIHNCGEQGVYAIFRDSIFRGNDVYSAGTANVLNKNQLMQVQTSGGQKPTGNVIEGNRFHDGPGDCLIFTVTSANIVRRNLFYSCVSAGIRVSAGAGNIDDSKIDHNTFYGNGTGLVISNTASRGNQIRNNAAVGNMGTQISICSGCGTTTTNLTTGTPTLIWTNPASRDFTLRTGSSAIDACSDIGLPFNGSFPDCGALESGASVGDTASPEPPKNLRVQ